jgi:hypothetical protein
MEAAINNQSKSLLDSIVNYFYLNGTENLYVIQKYTYGDDQEPMFLLLCSQPVLPVTLLENH